MICSNCNKKLSDGALFCSECGGKAIQEPAPEQAAPAVTYCPQCGNPNLPGSRFCTKCAYPLAAEQGTASAAPVYAAPVAAPTVAPVVAAPVEEKPKKVRKKININWKKLALIGGISAGAVLIVVVALLILPKLLFGGNEKYALYLKDMELFSVEFGKDPVMLSDDLLGGEDMEEEVLAKDSEYIGDYIAIRQGGNRVFYPDDCDDSVDIYYRDLDQPDKEPIRVASDVWLYAVSRDGNELAYLDNDDCLYYSDSEGSEELAKDVDVFYANENLDTILYLDMDWNMYVKAKGREARLLAGPLDGLPYISDDLQMVYYFIDDVLYAHKTYGDWERIDDNVSEVNHILKSGEIYYTVNDGRHDNVLYYYDGNRATKICTEILRADFVENKTIGLVRDADKEWYVIQGEELLELDDVDAAILSPDGKTLLSFEYRDGNLGDLYKTEVRRGSLGEPERLDRDVYSPWSGNFLDDGSIFWVKEDNELYIDGKYVDYDVLSNVRYSEEAGGLLYYVDWDYDDYEGTLMLRKGRRSIKLADGVSKYIVAEDGTVFFKSDDCLYQHKYGKTERIDSDVIAMIAYTSVTDILRGDVEWAYDRDSRFMPPY